MTKPSPLELPPGVQLIYLAEGGANVIYRFKTTTSLPSQLTGKLLRLRKQTAANITYTEIVRNFDNIIRPLFNPDSLIDQTLIRLPAGLLEKCNEGLCASECAEISPRPQKRHGSYLALTEPFGLLITDMTVSESEPGATLAELKPKWLNQSPSAPTTAYRCRTCALREMKNCEAVLCGAREHRSFCPLDLVSEEYEHVFRATGLIKCKERTRLARILFRNPTLLRLQSLQKAERGVGLLGPGERSWDMSLAMTLRDCTMFVKVSYMCYCRPAIGYRC
jgi:inositol-pentakisphosphate 2-kinase